MKMGIQHSSNNRLFSGLGAYGSNLVSYTRPRLNTEQSSMMEALITEKRRKRLYSDEEIKFESELLARSEKSKKDSKDRVSDPVEE